jgi:hypothetical protein
MAAGAIDAAATRARAPVSAAATVHAAAPPSAVHPWRRSIKDHARPIWQVADR